MDRGISFTRPTELSELERINKDFGESLDTESAKSAKNPELVRKFVNDRDSFRELENEVIAQYNLASMYTESLPHTEVVSKMWGEYIKKRKLLHHEMNKRIGEMFQDLADTSDRSRSVIGKESRIGANANNFYNATRSKNLKPHGALAYSRTKRSTSSRLVERRSDRQRAREHRLALH